jgi:hypothetical protein
LADYRLSVDEMRSMSKVEYTAFLPPPEKEPGKILEGSDVERVQQLIKHLTDDEKVI